VSTPAPAEDATTVALIEDQQVLVGAIQRSLAALPDLRVVGTAATLEEGIALVASTRPDVLVSDFRLTDGDIPDRLAEVLEQSPATRVLVFTGWPDESSFLEAESDLEVVGEAGSAADAVEVASSRSCSCSPRARARPRSPRS